MIWLSLLAIAGFFVAVGWWVSRGRARCGNADTMFALLLLSLGLVWGVLMR